MRVHLVAVLTLFLVVAGPASAKEAFLSVGGSVNEFRTDARVLNPSGSKTITVQAWLLPSGNLDNSGVQPVVFTIPPRTMRVFDDVVSTLFQGSGVGAIRLLSDDDFIATQRIYAQTPDGTLGQFVPGLALTDAKSRGALVQLESTPGFRTNIGAVNPNASTATVVWSLYDRTNARIASGPPVAMPPYGVIGPTNVASTFFFNAPGADLTDAWVSYDSDRPIFAYASLVDNATTDPTFIPASEDTGEDPAPPQTKTFNVSARQFEFTILPALNLSIGDVVTFRIATEDVQHGFTLVAPDGSIVIPAVDLVPEAPPLERTFTVTQAGQYRFSCTHVCGVGHFSMTGTFSVPAGKRE